MYYFQSVIIGFRIYFWVLGFIFRFSEIKVLWFRGKGMYNEYVCGS